MAQTETVPPAPVAASQPDPAALRRTGRAGGRGPRTRRSISPRRVALHVATLSALLLTWWLVTRAGLVRPLYLPSPGAVWEAFVRANSDHPIGPGIGAGSCAGSRTTSCGSTCSPACNASVSGWARPSCSASPSDWSWPPPGSARCFEPYLNFLRSLPPLAYIGLLIVWFGIGDTSKIWLLFLAAFPPVAMATISGVRGVREDQVNAVLSLGASRTQALTSVILPATLPEVLTGIRVATGFAWTTVVAAEIANGIPGIGGLAYLAGEQLQSALVIACIVVIGMAAVLLDLGLKSLEALLVPWRGKA